MEIRRLCIHNFFTCVNHVIVVNSLRFQLPNLINMWQTFLIEYTYTQKDETLTRFFGKFVRKFLLPKMRMVLFVSFKIFRSKKSIETNNLKEKDYFTIYHSECSMKYFRFVKIISNLKISPPEIYFHLRLMLESFRMAFVVNIIL